MEKATMQDQEVIDEFDKLILEPSENTVNSEPAEVAKDEGAKESATSENDSVAGSNSSNELPQFDGISTPDGKRIIPFSRLNEEIEARTKAEQIAQQAAREVEVLKEQLAKSGYQDVANLGIPEEALEKLAELEEYDPEAAAVFRKTLEAAQANAQKAAHYEAQEQAKREQDIANYQAQQQAVIESYPNLAAMQNNELQWKTAESVYQSMFMNPDTAQLSDIDKIARLNDVMSVMYGLKPTVDQNALNAAASQQPPKMPLQQQVEAVNKPYSLSDLGGGVIPTSNSGQKDVMQLSTEELTKLWATKDYDEIFD
jgi:hypothetical protein